MPTGVYDALPILHGQHAGETDSEGDAQVDFAPGYECMMHRTQSLDYGIVLEGTVEMILDDGSRTLMHRGDVAVQRATMHAWKNPSKTEWTRMQFILQDIQPLTVGGKRYGEDLGRGTEGLPSSGNDN